MGKIVWEKPKIDIDSDSYMPSDCNSCGSLKNHKLLVSSNFEDTYFAEDTHDNSITEYKKISIIQCQGCMQPSVIMKTWNSEHFDYFGENYEPIFDIEHFPKINDLVAFDGLHYLPTALMDLYSETLTAINNNCLTIAGIGIRGLIETVCNENNISGNNLFEKIDNLFSDGKISHDGKEILQSLRKLYNQSAHKSFKPSKTQLKLSLEIMELVMKQIYVHSRQAKNILK